MRAEEIHLAFVIADLCGYTALTEAHGNIDAARAVTRYADIAQAALQPSARLIERVGDEVVIAAETAAAAVRTAVALREAIESEDLFPTLRTGIHAGSVAVQGGKYFGRALNLAARVAAHARGGQILCTDGVRRDAGDLDGVTYRPLGSVQFKNIVDPVPVFQVITRGDDREPAWVDPVCRMQVRAESAPARLPYAGITYYFCSFECAKTFAERPEGYVAAPSA